MNMDHNFPIPASSAPRRTGGALPQYGFADMTRDMQLADQKFWTAHAAWRAAEDAYNADPREAEHPEAFALFERACELRNAMFSSGVFSASALSAKLVAIDEGMRGSCIDMKLPGGFAVFDVIQWDCERVAKREYLPELGAGEL